LTAGGLNLYQWNRKTKRFRVEEKEYEKKKFGCEGHSG